MNPQDQLMELLQEHSFDLVRHRKHKIYRNPDGLMFVTASTPSDRQAPQNALSTLKKILRQANSALESLQVADPTPLSEPVPEVHAPLPVEPVPSIEPMPAIQPAPAYISDEEWEAWKRRYWHDEKLHAKNERFLSVVSAYVDRASELMHERGHLALDVFLATDAVKSKMRDFHYKSKVLLYNIAVFKQGIVFEQGTDMPVLWASNGHIGISALVYCNVYTQHEPSRVTTLRFDLDGFPVLCELPEKGARKFLLHCSAEDITLMSANYPKKGHANS